MAETQIDLADEADLTSSIDEMIAENGGDAREAVRTLLISNALLQQAHDRALNLVPHGYMRGRATGQRSQPVRFVTIAFLSTLSPAALGAGLVSPPLDLPVNGQVTQANVLVNDNGVLPPYVGPGTCHMS